jgi:hypothetical protein
MLSVCGTLQLGASMAAARSGDRPATIDFLHRAERCAALLGGDHNYLWTAFGRTNIAVHQVATAMELGDVQTAVKQGPLVDTSRLPTERHVRHNLEVARALTAWNRVPEALALVLDLEQLAPEQVHPYTTAKASSRSTRRASSLMSRNRSRHRRSVIWLSRRIEASEWGLDIDLAAAAIVRRLIASQFPR